MHEEIKETEEMEVAKVIPMNGGIGDTSYAKSSLLQVYIHHTAFFSP